MKTRNQKLVLEALLAELERIYPLWADMRRRKPGEHQRDLFLWSMLKKRPEGHRLDYLLGLFKRESELSELWTAWRCKTIADDLLGHKIWHPEVIWAVWTLIFPGGPSHLYDLEKDLEGEEALEVSKAIQAIAKVLATASAEDELIAQDESRCALLAYYGAEAEAADRDRHDAPRDLCKHRGKWLDGWSDQVVRTLGEYLPDETRRLEWKHQSGLSFYIGQAVQQALGESRYVHHSFEPEGGWPEEIEDVLESEIIALVERFNEEEG